MPAIAPGIRTQSQLDDLVDFSGTIASGGSAQVVLPQQLGRLTLLICNLSPTRTLTVGMGPPACTAVIASNAVSSITTNNAGMGYSVAPNVRILGGLVTGDYRNAPSHPAVAHAVMTGAAPNQSISSIVVDDPGAGYLVAPLIYLENPLPRLGGGCESPSGTVGIPLSPGFTLSFSGMLLIPTSAVAIFGTTTGDAFECKVGGLV